MNIKHYTADLRAEVICESIGRALWWGILCGAIYIACSVVVP